jgi:hypothetical protein
LGNNAPSQRGEVQPEAYAEGGSQLLRIRVQRQALRVAVQVGMLLRCASPLRRQRLCRRILLLLPAHCCV